MSRPLFRIALVTALVATLVLAGEFAPEALARVPTFRARHHEFHGLRYLTEGSVLRTAQIGPDASIWDDPSEWVERLERHPLVESASVERRFPSTLVVRVEERVPVGLVPTPTLEPVDREGRYLTLDPARFPLDYPILRVPSVPGRPDVKPSEVRIRQLASAAAVMRLEADFWREVSEIEPGIHGGIVVRRGNPEVVFRFPPQVETRRIRAGMVALEDAVTRGDGSLPLSVDLRFADYVFLDWDRGDRS